MLLDYLIPIKGYVLIVLGYKNNSVLNNILQGNMLLQ